MDSGLISRQGVSFVSADGNAAHQRAQRHVRALLVDLVPQDAPL
jgi:hypothetical protein